MEEKRSSTGLLVVCDWSVVTCVTSVFPGTPYSRSLFLCPQCSTHSSCTLASRWCEFPVLGREFVCCHDISEHCGELVIVALSLCAHVASLKWWWLQLRRLTGQIHRIECVLRRWNTILLCRLQHVHLIQIHWWMKTIVISENEMFSITMAGGYWLFLQFVKLKTVWHIHLTQYGK